MKELRESLLDTDFDIDEGYIEYDWFKWPAIQANDDFLARVRDCNKGMYAKLVSGDIDKLIAGIESHTKEYTEKGLFRDVKNDHLKYALNDLTTARNELKSEIEYWDSKMIGLHRKTYKFLDELFTLPFARRILQGLKAHDVCLALDKHFGQRTWWFHMTVFNGRVDIKNRQALVKEWTKIFKKHGIDDEDIQITNADGKKYLELINSPEKSDKLELDKQTLEKIKKMSENAEFEIRIEFDADRL